MATIIEVLLWLWCSFTGCMWRAQDDHKKPELSHWPQKSDTKTIVCFPGKLFTRGTTWHLL